MPLTISISSVQEWKLLIMKSLDGKGGGLLPMENNMWQVTLAEYGGKRAPIDEEGFLEFAKELPDPIMYQTLKRCKPVTEGNSTLTLFHHYSNNASQ